MSAEVINFTKNYKSNTGGFLLRGLFFETTLADKTTVLYTLKDVDHAGYPSLRRLYLETSDPTEYSFALRCFSGWAHWERLLGCDWFQPYIERWRRELEIQIRSRALSRIRALAESHGKEAFNANKFLLAGSWKTTPSTKVTKDEVKDAESKLVQEDAKRLENVLTTN